MEEWHIIPVYIPGGCTGYVQPMDAILNKPIKDKIADILEQKEWRRQMIVLAVIAFSSLKQLDKHGWRKDSIIKSFKKAGISISPDGTEDNYNHHYQ